MSVTGFWCSCCEQWHEGMPMDVVYDLPSSLLGASENPHPDTRITSDWCVIEGKDFFVRGVLPLPVTDNPDDDFRFGLWVQVSEKGYWRMMELWDDERSTQEPPYFGYLMNTLHGYPETWALETNVITHSITERPLVILHESDHPLAVEQREGITMARVQEIVERALHPPNTEGENRDA